MTKSNFFLGFAIFAFCTCFAFIFTASGPRWLWQDQMEVPILLGSLALPALGLFYLQKRKARQTGEQ